MSSVFQIYRLHRFVFLLLLLVTVLDPGNNIFKLKEFFFVLTFLIGLVNFKKYTNFNILIGSISFSLAFPLIWLFFGYIFDYNFSSQFAIMYLKSFAFFLILNVSLDNRIDFSKLFVFATFLLIPITIFLFFLIGEFKLAEMALLNYGETFAISRRAFGGIVFDPVIFYKTSPLLIFGLSYLCQENRFKYSILNIILILFCLATMIISGTRANMLGSFIILFYFIYKNYVSISKLRKSVFWSLSVFVFVFFFIPFLSEFVFDKNEQSNETKLSIINDYFSLWSENPFSIVFGQGLGGGFNTIERGLSYMAEPTYFEILRMFGLVGGIIFLFFLIIPLYLFFKSKSTDLFEKHFYMLVAYIIYILIEFPSNPLLLSSTGMIVMVVIYSASIEVFSSRNQKLISNS